MRKFDIPRYPRQSRQQHNELLERQSQTIGSMYHSTISEEAKVRVKSSEMKHQIITQKRRESKLLARLNTDLQTRACSLTKESN